MLSSSSGRRLPGASLFLALPALLLLWAPRLAPFLAFDRGAVAAGEVWRLLTGHWVHWSLAHLLWDLAAFLGLATACELAPSCGRRRMLSAVALAAIAIPAVLWIALPRMPTYRGLSGLDSALFVLLVVTLLREDWHAGHRAWAAAEIAVLVLFLGKCLYEAATGEAFFATAGGFVPVPLAHLVGGLMGLAVAGSGAARDCLRQTGTLVLSRRNRHRGARGHAERETIPAVHRRVWRPYIQADGG
jgi:rhomboid family GlyGly-CTERM serine protease